MSRRPARYTQADIHRAVKALKQAGEEPSIELLPDGTMRIVPLRPIVPQPKPPAPKRRITL